MNLILMSAIVLLSAGWLLFWWYSGLNTLPSGVRVSGWSVGGLTEEQFSTQLDARLKTIYSRTVRLELPGQKAASVDASLGQLGLDDNRELLSSYFDYLTAGKSRLERLKRRWELRHTEWPLELSISEPKLRQKLSELWPSMMRPAIKNAERIITTDDQVHYIPEIRAVTVDVEKLRASLEQLAAGLLEQGRKSDPDSGSGLGSGSAKGKIDTVPVSTKEAVPDVTMQTLKDQRVERKIVEFSTSFPSSSAGRIHNIQVTASMIHDRLLAPGERFDYASVIKAVEKAYGFREAPVIFNGKLVPGIGGGICQVSTTLYNAVLRAGIKVNERRNHSLPISYAPLGQDATFADGYINFVFTNNSGGHLLIRTEVSHERITVKLFGTMPAGVSYELESNIVETLAPTIKYVHNPTLRPGQQSVIQEGKPGYVVETYRIRLENGTAVSRTLVSKDTYSAQPKLVAVNNGDSKPEEGAVPPGGGKSIVEDGVSGPHFREGR